MSKKRDPKSVQWRHNGRDGFSNHQPHDCLLNRLFRCRSTKTSKFRVTGLCAGNSPVTGEFPAQMASHAENVSIWWRHHVESSGGIPSKCRFRVYAELGYHCNRWCPKGVRSTGPSLICCSDRHGYSKSAIMCVVVYFDILADQSTKCLRRSRENLVTTVSADNGARQSAGILEFL